MAPGAHGITIYLRARLKVVPCPDCGEPTGRIHSRYSRTLADLPWHGTAVRLRVETRRFFCPVSQCGRRIFAERLSETADRYARRTRRLDLLLRQVALVLGGEAGSRLSRDLSVGVSPDTLLRRIRAATLPNAAPRVRVLGVDEWAYRKGRDYGTVLVDLERRRIVDLLPDRSADSFAAWLESHPGVEVITRDRSGVYSEGARRGAPGAVQVADRWHLIRNLTAAVERALLSKSALLKEAAASLASPPATEPVRILSRPSSRAERAKASRRQARLRRYEEVYALHRSGMPKRQIARTVGLSRQTVTRWLSSGSFPERQERPPVDSILAPYYAYLERRFSAGCHNAAKLWREIRAQGYVGGATLVRDYVRGLRKGLARQGEPLIRRPSARRVAWWLVARESELTAEERAYVASLSRRCSEVRLIRFLAHEFRRMLSERDTQALGPWIEAARQSLLRRFARGIHADVAAVRAAIALPWSNGPVEGEINRLKTIKRQMYGRAGFDLLRQRVLCAA